MFDKQLKGLVFNIQRYSIHDGPGIRTLVFLKGCPLRCLWCCNPESQSPSQEIIFTPTKCIECGRCVEVCPTGAAELYLKKDNLEAKKLCVACMKCIKVCPSDAKQMIGRYMSLEEAMEEVEKDFPYYKRSGGGVTISGGEPLMQTDFVRMLLKRCKEKGIHTGLETCGYTKWHNFEKVIEYVDVLLYDIKHMDSKRHKKLTGVGNELIFQNAKKIAISGKDMIIRVPIIPGYQDSLENMEATAKFARTLKIEKIHLLPYHRLGESKYSQLGRNYKLKGVNSPSKRSISKLKKVIESYNLKVCVVG